MSCSVNLNPKRKEKSFLSFRRQCKSLEVSFQVDINPKRQDYSFLSFWRQDKWVPVSFRLNLNCKREEKWSSHLGPRRGLFRCRSRSTSIASTWTCRSGWLSGAGTSRSRCHARSTATTSARKSGLCRSGASTSRTPWCAGYTSTPPLTNRKGKDKSLKLPTRCKDIEHLLHKTLCHCLCHRKHQSYSIPHSAAQAAAQAGAKQTVQ